MKKTIILASQNSGKIKEYQNALKDFEIISLNDLDEEAEIEETGSTFKENALIKAKTLYDRYKKQVIADDSGIIVSCLKNELGVKSKRFSKSQTDEDNNNLLLKKLEGENDRTAYFQTVICLYNSPEDIRFYEGKTYGVISKEKRGTNGFGYDPLFLVNGLNKTYAELSIEEKKDVSHRGKAMKKLIEDINK